MKSIFHTSLLFIKNGATIVGLITAVLFQVFFNIIWLSGYDQVNARMTQLAVTIVNEDGTAAEPVANSLAEGLNFAIKPSATMEEARQMLTDRDVYMIIEIPSGFMQQAGDLSGPVAVKYVMNESNVSTVKSVMQTVSAQVTAALNREVQQNGIRGVLDQSGMAEEQANTLAQGLSSRVEADVERVNPVNNFAFSMVPMLIVTATFTGAMLLGMNLQKVSGELSGRVGKWERFWARNMINLGAAFIVSLVGASMMHLMGVSSVDGWWMLWLFQLLVTLSFMFVAQLSLLLLGNAGAWMNSALLPLLMLTSGSTIPRDVLPDFYQQLGHYLPATYAVEGMMNLVLGGNGIRKDVLFLAIIGVVTLTLGILLTWIRRSGPAFSGVPLESKSATTPATLTGNLPSPDHG
ncbi:ABC transporter permease [Paenibacillus taichungensis]|uniref:YhgE/Pip domain-containing protein n=1 Tax=Paenibacillus taichungensis TaxID=484184 RepID=UPI002DBE05A4|nr:ABC transporter permease [Paenibacillus taichungensis]MEC0105693.1 ABC transporter permease [Paenibacillus taichungensis]MEC0198246.1 ABC transporter permease [Paenibacillus taichungensis]